MTLNSVDSVVSDSFQPHGLFAQQGPLPMGFSRQGYWSGLPSLGDVHLQGISPAQRWNLHLLCFLHCRNILYPLSHLKPKMTLKGFKKQRIERHIVCMHAFSLSCSSLFATLWTIACQTPPSMEFSRQEY